MDTIRDLIKSAMNKDASGFEDAFNSAMSPKIDTALGTAYDAMFGKPAEVSAEDLEQQEVEQEQPEESNENEEI